MPRKTYSFHNTAAEGILRDFVETSPPPFPHFEKPESIFGIRVVSCPWIPEGEIRFGMDPAPEDSVSRSVAVVHNRRSGKTMLVEEWLESRGLPKPIFTVGGRLLGPSSFEQARAFADKLEKK